MFRIKKRTRLAFIVILIICPWILELIPAISHYLDILVFAGIYTLITIGLSLLMGYAGQISLGHAAFFGIGAYLSGILTVHYGWNPWFCMVIGVVVCGFVAYLIGTPSLKLQGHYLAMATLAFGIIVFIVFNEEVDVTGGPDGMGGIPGLSLWRFSFDTALKYYYLVWGIVVVAFLFSVNLIQSRLGRALRAIHTSEIGAKAMGVDVSQYKIQIFSYSAVLASIAGSLYAHYMNFINPGAFDLTFSVKLLIMIVIGGMHSIWGAVLGAVLISFLSLEWLEVFKEGEILVYGAVLLLVTIFLPDGLVSLPEKIKRFRKK
ncbi:MAG: branched-chain amino acid ABC transporter permease [Proteobacteria bacterium]|nr:branched-chain amino acid ABC transporter permease [Pseudomonadota bacterium]